MIFLIQMVLELILKKKIIIDFQLFINSKINCFFILF
jgi:hypothetical protein